MDERLRAYLEEVGLRHDADESAAWDYYNQLQGGQKARAAGIRNGLIRPVYESGDRGGSGASGGDGGEAGNEGDDPEPAPAGGRTRSATPPTPSGGGDDPALPDLDRVRREAAEAERQRIADIQALPFAEEYPELVRSLCQDARVTVDVAARRILEQQRGQRPAPSGQAPAGHTRQDGRADQLRAITAGLLIRAGLPMESLRIPGEASGDRVRAARERAFNTGDQFRGQSLIDICALALRAEGRDVPHNYEERFRSAMSTAALTQIFTDSVNAAVDRAFEVAEDTTRGWTEEGEVSDFKVNTDITIGKTAGLKRHSRGGTAHSATFSDEGETFRALRYTEQFSVDEMDIIDDSFGALMEVPMLLAEDAAQVRPDLVYAILLANGNLADGVALFHSTHSNTATDALSASALRSGLTAMSKQTHSGRNLNLRARHVLVPQDLGFTAEELIRSPQLLLAGNTDAERGNVNVLAGQQLNVISDNRLGVAGVTDPATGDSYAGTATNWFLAAARRTVKVVYRRGSNRRPQVRQYVLDKGQWGVGWDIVLDIGAYARDYRGLQRRNS